MHVGPGRIRARPSRPPTSSLWPAPSSWSPRPIVFLEAYGVDIEAAIKVLAGGLAGNRDPRPQSRGMLRRDFTPGFRIDLHHKDLGIVTSAAREAGVVIPLGAVVAQLVASLGPR